MESHATTREYHVDPESAFTSPEDLRKWANDPDCLERGACAKLLAEQRATEEKREAKERHRLAERRQSLQDNPFDPRTEVSADAKRIVINLWIIFVLLPFALAVLYLVLR